MKNLDAHARKIVEKVALVKRKAGFQKGHGQMGGRQKGTICLSPKEWSAFGQWLVVGGAERLHTEMNELHGKDYIVAFTSVLEYFAPKLARTEITGKGDEAIHIHLD